MDNFSENTTQQRTSKGLFWIIAFVGGLACAAIMFSALFVFYPGIFSLNINNSVIADEASDSNRRQITVELLDGENNKRLSLNSIEINSGSLNNIMLSPLGRFVSFKRTGGQPSGSFVIDLLANRDVLRDILSDPVYSYEEIDWLLNDDGFVFITRLSLHDGSGTTAVYLWKSENPSNVEVIARIEAPEMYSLDGKWYSNLYVYPSGNQISFVENTSTEKLVRVYDLDSGSFLE